MHRLEIELRQTQNFCLDYVTGDYNTIFRGFPIFAVENEQQQKQSKATN